MKKILLLILVSLLCICGCSKDENKKALEAEKITYEQAKEMITNGAVLLDVRTESEYNESHIEGAILLPYGEITESTAKEYLSNKNTVVIVYCRSGGRSRQAGINLLKLGYTNVYDLGSIDNWKE